MSVSQIRDQVLECIFKNTHAPVLNSSSETLCRLERQLGLYMTRPKLE